VLFGRTQAYVFLADFLGTAGN